MGLAFFFVGFRACTKMKTYSKNDLGMIVDFMSMKCEGTIAHILTVTCVIGLVGSAHCALIAALYELTVVKLGTLAYWIVFRLRWSYEHIRFVFSV